MVRFVTLCLIQAYKLGFTFSSGVSRDPQYRLFLNSWLCWSFFCLSTEVKHLSRLFSYVSCGILFFDPNIVSTTFLKLRFLLVKLIFIPSFLFVMVPDLFFFNIYVTCPFFFLSSLKALHGLLLSQWKAKGGLAEKLTFTSGYQVS